jgi:hypothetical protein
VGAVGQHPPVVRILAAISRYPSALTWARQTAQSAWGPVALASDSFSFIETDYYASSMGPNLVKTFFAFQQLVDPAELVEMKQTTNRWEELYRQQHPAPEIRPLNLDPGYLSEAKLVLASTKDHCHRIYLGQGIYAEITLYYQGRKWRHRPWTYPDYRRQDYQEFFSACRTYLREQRTGES